jgi:hypothetical protein
MYNSSQPTPNSSNSSDEAHDDLLATLAAARELNPDMDKALADQYLARRKEEKQRQEQQAPAVVPSEQTPAYPRWRVAPVIPILCAFMVCAILVAAFAHNGQFWHDGQFWWFFWIPLIFGGWWWRRGYPGSSDSRYQRYLDRERYRQARWEARHGYLPPSTAEGPRNATLPTAQPTSPGQSGPAQPTAGEPAAAMRPSQPPSPTSFTPGIPGAPPMNPAG